MISIRRVSYQHYVVQFYQNTSNFSTHTITIGEFTGTVRCYVTQSVAVRGLRKRLPITIPFFAVFPNPDPEDLYDPTPLPASYILDHHYFRRCRIPPFCT